MPQFCPAVKSKTCDLLRIGLVRLGSSERFVAKGLDEAWVDRADEDTSGGEPGGYRLIVSAGMLHADLCLAVQFLDCGDEVIDGRLRVTVIPRRENDHISWLANRDGASSFGNINTNCVHETIPFVRYCNGQHRLLSLPIQSTGYVTRTRGSTCVKRTLRMRIRLADYFTDESPWRYWPDRLHPHSNSLSNEMDDSLTGGQDHRPNTL